MVARTKTSRTAASVGSQPVNRELDILTLLVAKMLRDEHRIDDHPEREAYRIVADDEYGEGRPDVHVDVDLGRGLVCAVEERWFCTDGGPDVGEIVDAARQVSELVARLAKEKDETRRMIREVTSATRRQIAKGNRQGIPYMLTSVLPRPLRSRADEPVAEVRFKALAEFLRPVEFSFDAVCAEEVAHEFDRMREKQQARAERLADLAPANAAGCIDTIVLSALRAAGVDDGSLLRSLRDTDDWIVDVNGADGRRFVLFWDNGIVSSRNVALADGVRWVGNALVFDKSPRALDRRLDGRSASEVFRHPAITDKVTVLSAHGKKGDEGRLYCVPPLAIFGYDDERIAA